MFILHIATMCAKTYFWTSFTQCISTNIHNTNNELYA